MAEAESREADKEALGGIRAEQAIMKAEYARMEAKLREMEQTMLQQVCQPLCGSASGIAVSEEK